jgi:hypothetical protein
MKFFRIVCSLAALSCFASALLAADAKAAVSSHEQAARELYELMGGKNLAQTASMAVVAQLQSNPEMAPYKDVLESWVHKVYSGDTIDKQMVQLYVETYSENELRQIIVFYKTPVGQKVLSKMPEIMQKGMTIGQTLAQEHMPELREALTARQHELEAKQQQEQKKEQKEQKPPR